jgi:hypothetical protein
MKIYRMTGRTAENSWYRIVALIKAGGYPKMEHLIAALKRGEEAPVEAQTYLAHLLAGRIDKRGKARKQRTGAEQQLRDAALLARVEHWRQVFRTRNERGPLARAYGAVTQEIGRSRGHIEREYKAAASRRKAGWPLLLVMTPEALDDAYWRYWVGERRGITSHQAGC